MIAIDISGIEGVQDMLRKMPDELADAFYRGAKESSEEILQTTGLQSYPRLTEANQPPTPYYKRTIGMQRGGIRVPEYNDNKSENLGKQFYTERRDEWSVAIGNRASYAPFVVGQDQAGAMAKIGWRKLADVAEDKKDKITDIVIKWVRRAINRLSP